jgi:hypothetical protein
MNEEKMNHESDAEHYMIGIATRPIGHVRDIDGQLLIELNNDIYMTDDAQNILDALPGWLRRLVVWYAKRRMSS